MNNLESSEASFGEIMFYSIVGSYILTSLILLRFPNLLHKKKQIKFKAVKISHRGGCGEGIENTISNFENAVKAGSEMLEMDCQMTSDGEIVVVHDLDLSNVCERPVKVQSTSYKTLPLYKSRITVPFANGHIIEVSQNADRRIPLLREVFEKFPNIPINIDVKTRSEEAVTKVVSLIKEFDREGITVLGSFSGHVAKKCQEMRTDMPQFCSFSRVMKILISFYLGLLPFMSINESFFEIMMPSIGYDIIMNRILFRHLQRRGIRVYVWVLNHEDQFERALTYGVDGIMTDFPTRLTAYMNSKAVKNMLNAKHLNQE